MMKNRERYGLYIHIPFCIKKCGYCDFLSFPMDGDGRMAYLHALAAEMKLWRKTLPDFIVDTVYIGGGTPSSLETGELAFLFRALLDTFSLDAVCEFTIECNPGTVTAEKLQLMRQAGVNRISFGLQSTVNKELKALGRIHSYEDFVRGFELARTSGFDNVSVDVMAAIPEQSLQSYVEGLGRLIRLGPEHISAYSLIIEEGTPFYSRYGDTPPVDEETDRLMYKRTGEILAEAGYRRYEISNYAKRGRECRHNIKYWRRQEYIGMGLSAASFLGKRRIKNETGIERYQERIRKGQLPFLEEETLTCGEEMAEYMFLGLRMMEGVSVEGFEKQFHQTFAKRYGDLISRFISQGLLKRDGDRIFLTGSGIDVSNRIFAELI